MAGNSRQMLKSANPSTIHDKFLVGYQGWFTCAGDGEPVGPGHHGWLHWFNYPIPDGGRPNTDVWPDVSSYSPSELFPAPGLKTKSGQQTFLFSSRNAKTVQRHFHWMAEHGVDGVFLQRFAGECDIESGSKGILRIRDEVGERVREAAEREGRVFAIMYDVSGVPADRIQRILQRDWVHLVHDLGVLDSPNYLRERGKPVIALWGFGFDNRHHTPTLVREITKFFRNTTPGGVYIMGGAPAHWRTGVSDADRNPEFLEVWLNEFDAISPWTVGRYRTEHEADNFAKTKMQGDWELITNRNQEGNTRKIDYIPVVLPGGSGYNLSEGKWGFNDIKREGGRFLWRQIYNARRLGVRTMYGAMWDEYDEGTAFMPIVEHKRDLPESDKYPFLSLDEDGYDLPSDWYMRICGFAAEGLRSERRILETFPVKELQDYWSSRPKYEDVNPNSKDFRSGSLLTEREGGSVNPNGPEGGQTYHEWLALQKEEKEEVPPPPYTLEDDELTDPIPPQTDTRAATAAIATPEVLSGTVPPVVNVQPVASSSHTVPSSSHHAAASPPVVNINTYPASAAQGSRQEAYSQVSAHPHSPQPHIPAQGHSSQPHLSPGGIHGQQLVSPSHSQGHSPQSSPSSGISQHLQSLPPSQSHSPQPYSPALNQPTQSHSPHAGSHHLLPPLPTQTQNSQHPQPYPPGGGAPYQGHVTPPGHSQGYPPANAPSQGYTSPNAQPSQPYPTNGGPVRQGYSPVDVQGYPSNPYHIHNQSQDPVTALANEFGRQSISGPSEVSAGGRLPSPPPLHPAHPNYLRRPSSSSLNPSPPPLHPAHPNHPTRPSSSLLNPNPPSHPPQSQTGHSAAVSNATLSASGQAPATSTNRPRWPPAEWDSDTPPVTQFSGRRPSAAGNGRVEARPHAAETSSYNPAAESTLRPTLSTSTRPSRPHITSNTNMPSAYYPPTPNESTYGSAANTHSAFPSHTSPPMHDEYIPFPTGPQSYMPSGYPDPTMYRPTIPGSWPASGHLSPPIAFPDGPMVYNVSGPQYGSGIESQYPGGPAFPSASTSGSHDGYHGGQFHQFPEGPSGVYGSNITSSSSPSSAPWSSAPSAPPIVHHHSHGSPTGYYPSSSNTKHSGGALGFALSAVDKIAGRKAKDQLENHVDNLTHSGNKLFNKFTK